MTYTFKPIELFWAALTAVVTVILQALISFDPTQITDFRLWAIGIGAGAVRAAAAALIVFFTKSVTDQPDPGGDAEG